MVEIKRKISQYNHYNNNKVVYIVLHGTGSEKGTDTAEDNATYFANGDRGASAHYFVDAKEIWQSVEDFNGAWHVGDGEDKYGNYKYGIGNQNSIGIEMCLTDFGITAETEKNALELVKHLQAKYNVPNSNVVRHYDASRKPCPAQFKDNSWKRWKEFKKKLEGATASKPDTSKPSNSTSFKVGNKVKVIGSYYATGEAVPDWVKSNVYTVMEVSGNKVLLKEILSWVYSKDVTLASASAPAPSNPAPSNVGRLCTPTNCTALNVRSGGGTGYAVIGTVYPGGHLKVLAEANGWLNISYVTFEGRTVKGWVSKAYTRWVN